MTSGTPLQPGAVIGKYRVQRVLGAGGMATVYEADDTQLGRKVALKVPRLEAFAPGLPIGSILDEARAAAALSSPYIVTVYEVGEHEGRPFLAMELLGRSLADLLQVCPRQSVGAAVWVGLRLASACAAAHRLRVVHRDIKPANVLLTANGMDAKMADFGIARRDGSCIGGLSMGTPSYMAPEQFTGGSGDARADVHAIGAVLWEMLVGLPPFAGQTPQGILASRLAMGQPDIRRYRSDVPPELATLLAECLAHDPRGRPADGGALYRRLWPLSGVAEPPTASPRSVPARPLPPSQAQFPGQVTPVKQTPPPRGMGGVRRVDLARAKLTLAYSRARARVAGGHRSLGQRQKMLAYRWTRIAGAGPRHHTHLDQRRKLLLIGLLVAAAAVVVGTALRALARG